MATPQNDTLDRIPANPPPDPGRRGNGREGRPRPPGPEERRGATATSKGGDNETPEAADADGYPALAAFLDHGRVIGRRSSISLS